MRVSLYSFKSNFVSCFLHPLKKDPDVTTNITSENIIIDFKNLIPLD